MSAKQAKRLRKAAKGLAVTLDQAGRKIYERGLLAQEHKRMSGSPSSIMSSSSNPKEQVDPVTYAVTAINRPDSLRGIIRHLKKGVKSNKIQQPK